MTNPTRFDLARPCRTCPFRTDGAPILLGYDRRQEIAEAIDSDATFLCHEHMEWAENDDGDDEVVGGPQCAGATLTAGAPQLMRVYDRLSEGLDHPVVIPEPSAGVPWADAWDWLDNQATL